MPKELNVNTPQIEDNLNVNIMDNVNRTYYYKNLNVKIKLINMTLMLTGS